MTEVIAALIWDKAKFMISSYKFCPADEEILRKIIEMHL